MELIVLSGFARSGKDEVAKILVEDFGFKQIAFADKLREMLYALNPIVKQQQDAYFTRNVNTTYLQTIIDRYGWNGYKETEFGPEIRRLLQRLGTEAGRQTLGGNIWVDATLNDLPEDKFVISDGRFANEFDSVVQRGGYVWRVTRPGVGPLNDHPSETEAVTYDKFSLFIENNGTLDELADAVQRAYISGQYKEWGFN